MRTSRVIRKYFWDPLVTTRDRFYHKGFYLSPTQLGQRQIQENIDVHAMSEGASGEQEQIDRRTTKGDNQLHQRAGCLGQKGVVTATHNACIRELLLQVSVHGKADRHMRLLTIETESRLGTIVLTLWDQEVCSQFCSKKELWEAAKVEEMKIPWAEAQAGLPVPEEQ